MELPSYFNFEPIIAHAYQVAQELEFTQFAKWKPANYSELNYTLLHNKDGAIGWRPFELINPLIYGRCVSLLTTEENWKLVKSRFGQFAGGIVECCSLPVITDTGGNPTSKQILNWWKKVEQRSLELSLEFSHLKMTDVSNCYPSIYTHAIGWSIHGRDFLKLSKNRFDKSLLGNQLDELVRNSREGQTNGIPQASSLSHVLAELILGYCDEFIDRALAEKKGLKILRYRDDYRIFGNSDSDCNWALKVISEKLNLFGMKLGSAKTSNAANVISGSVKQDKVDALGINVRQKTLQKELLLIHRFGVNSPSSGALKFLLSGFLDRLDDKIGNKRFKNENSTVLAAVLLDIASISPHVFPAVATGISKMLAAIPKAKRDELFRLTLKRTSRIPNNGYLEVWLQRIAYPNGIEFLSLEQMCRLVSSEQKTIWNFDWIGDTQIRKTLEVYSIVDRSSMEDLSKTIKRSEFDAFWKGYE